MSGAPVCVGIDVAKAQVDVALRPSAEGWAVANNDVGIAALVPRLQALRPTLIVLGATGGWRFLSRPPSQQLACPSSS